MQVGINMKNRVCSDTACLIDGHNGVHIKIGLRVILNPKPLGS